MGSGVTDGFCGQGTSGKRRHQDSIVVEVPFVVFLVEVFERKQQRFVFGGFCVACSFDQIFFSTNIFLRLHLLSISVLSK